MEFIPEKPAYQIDISPFLEHFSQVKTIDVQLPYVQVWCLSDLHAENEEMMDWIRKHCVKKPYDDTFSVFICPGDITSDLARLRKVFGILKENYDEVCYLPGNHELWCPLPNTKHFITSAYNSLDKFHQVLQCAIDCGVHIGPVRFTNSFGVDTLVCPLYSWYHNSFDKDPDLTHKLFSDVEKICPFTLKWKDFHMCKWPDTLISKEQFVDLTDKNKILAEAFAAINEAFVPAVLEIMRQKIPPILISFSHFLPRHELVPEKRFLLEPHLTKVIGSDVLEQQIRKISSQLHMFGHTHIPIDLTFGDIRYVQWPLGYAREASTSCEDSRRNGPLLIFEAHFDCSIQCQNSQQAKWSIYYQENNRDPTSQELSPWLEARLKSFL